MLENKSNSKGQFYKGDFFLKTENAKRNFFGRILERMMELKNRNFLKLYVIKSVMKHQ